MVKKLASPVGFQVYPLSTHSLVPLRFEELQSRKFCVTQLLGVTRKCQNAEISRKALLYREDSREDGDKKEQSQGRISQKKIMLWGPKEQEALRRVGAVSTTAERPRRMS